MKETIRIISQIIVAVVFIFSGFVKCVDPTGTAIKMEEYFLAFGMDFMTPLSMALSVLMCGIELLTGIMLLLNLKIKWAIWLATALMAFYTPLTLWLAISDKVTDCGCFGDALVLTNWQTFFKNLVIDVFIVILIIYRNRFRIHFKPAIQISTAAAFAFMVFGFEFYNLSHLPVIDFMPYKIGANIQSGMIVPEGARGDVYYPPVLSYKKDGKVKKFTLENYPRNDTSWTFVESRSKLKIKGYVPPIHDFNILTPEGQDVKDMILSDPGYTLLLIYHSLKNADLKNMAEINRVAELALSKGYKVYGLTSSIPEDFEWFKDKAKASYPIYNMDATTLKTMIRSNPGLMLIKEGTIVGKWHHRQVKRIKNI